MLVLIPVVMRQFFQVNVALDRWVVPVEITGGGWVQVERVFKVSQIKTDPGLGGTHPMVHKRSGHRNEGAIRAFGGSLDSSIKRVP